MIEDEIVKELNEEKYQEIKKKMKKEDDYFDETELITLMQFLMQCERKVIKNEEKI